MSVTEVNNIQREPVFKFLTNDDFLEYNSRLDGGDLRGHQDEYLGKPHRQDTYLQCMLSRGYSGKSRKDIDDAVCNESI